MGATFQSAMGFRVKVAPGVRVRVSSRGVGASVGPRIARAHVGSGGAGFSSGLGPVSFYAGVRAGGRGSSGGPWSSVAEYEQAVRRGERTAHLDEVQRLHDQLVRHLIAHRQSFPAIRKPIVAAAIVDVEGRVVDARRSSAGAVFVLKVRQRRTARVRAEALARERARRDQDAANRAAAEEQALIDAAWNRLVANDPETVIATIENAFADNQVPAAAIDCEGAAVTLLMRFPPLDGMVPRRAPDMTPTGRPTIREYSKTERNGLYVAAMLSHVNATVAEAFAVAPSIAEATILVVSGDASELTPLYCASVRREDFAAGAWESQSSAIPGVGHAINTLGRTHELRALDLRDEPHISALVQRLATDLAIPIDPDTRLSERHNPPPHALERPSNASNVQLQIPARITQHWINEHVPAMSSDEYSSLLEVLETRGWTPDDVAVRVAPQREAASP